MDQRVEPPSWLPDGAAGSDAKGPVSHDSADDDLDSDGLDSQGPLAFGPVSQDPASQDLADSGPASYEAPTYEAPTYEAPAYDPVSYGSGGSGPGSSGSGGGYGSGGSGSGDYGSGSSGPGGSYSSGGGYGSGGSGSGGYGSDGSGSGGSGLGTQGSAITAMPGSAGDPPGRDLASGPDSYSYAGETLHSNGQGTTFGQESTPLSAYGQESGFGSGAGSAPPYPAQFGDLPAAAEKTSGARSRTAVFSAAPRKAKAGGTQARRADLVLARFEPWSVMKFSFLISLVAWVILFVAVAVLWFALDTLGVFTSIQKTLESVTSSSGSAGVSLTKWFSASRILGYTMLIGAVNIILITALSTVGSMIYNLVTHLGGGIEITLRESD